ncbi:MAG: hypothetical protein ACRDQD_30310 [Nocardioidaceae bacterium]
MTCIVAVEIVVIVLIGLLAVRGRNRKTGRRREKAVEHRRPAEVHTARAEQREAEIAEHQARAEREQAIAREQAAQLDEDRRAADDRREHARRIDPDSTNDDNARANQGHNREGRDKDPRR